VPKGMFLALKKQSFIMEGFCMAKTSLKEISKKMRRLDLCMMTTFTNRGMISSRPMSNNGDVKYDGNSYFFTTTEGHLVKDLKKNAHVNLAFTGPKKLFLSVTGEARVIKDRATMQKHWVDELDNWFDNGVDSPDLVMITVKAKRIKYWQKEKEGEWVL
jgi:general stress protein 26